jgi:transformation/transcription domain-associated protein
VDCFQKVRQQVKCYLQMAAVADKNELQKVSQEALTDAHLV